MPISIPLELVLFNLFFTVLGLTSHVVKKSMENKYSPIEYLVLHQKRTIVSVSSVLAGCATLAVTRPDASPMEYFTIGYVADSVLNRTPSQQEVMEKRMRKQVSHPAVKPSDEERLG